MIRSKLIFFSLLLFISTPSCIAHQIPTYTIDLDDAPETRWNKVATDYDVQMKNAISKAIKLFHIPTRLLELLQTQASAILAYIPKEYAGEIVGISHQTGISLTDMILINILYDMTAACTSIVAVTKDGRIIHGRNLDYNLAAELRNLTIFVRATKGGSTVFTGVSYAGMIGLATGQKPYKFTVSMNERDKGYRWENLYEMLLDRQANFVTFEIRRVLEMAGVDYAAALREFQVDVLVAPCYIIIGGIQPGEGAVITRGREAEMSVRFLNKAEGIWYVLETNYDWWDPPPSKDNRRDPAVHHMNTIGSANVSLPALYEVLSTTPVCNSGTTYTALMSAAAPQLLSAVVRDKTAPCTPA